QQPADQRALAVIHASGAGEPQHAGIDRRDVFDGGHQKYPSFLRSSMDASEVWSSMRVAPRSVIRVVAVSAVISTGFAAIDSTGQVQVMSPTVRKRTETISTFSPGLGRTSSETGSRPPGRRTTSRRCA